MGYSSWGHKELDMTKQQQSNFPSICLNPDAPPSHVSISPAPERGPAIPSLPEVIAGAGSPLRVWWRWREEEPRW